MGDGLKQSRIDAIRCAGQLQVEAEYLFDCIEDTISRDLKRELDFLKFFDAAMKEVMNIVDMPNQRAALLIKLIHQNKGKLSKAKREMFQEVSDQEIAKIETAILDAAQQFQATELISE